jgi:general stress protein 26
MMDENADPQEVRERMWEKMGKSPFVMVSLIGADQHAEPLTAQLDEDADGKFWFYLRKDNRVAAGGPAMVQFVSKDHKVFACIRGNLAVESDQAIVDKYWSNMVEAWFEGGKDDPNLRMLRFELQDAEIWEGDESILGKFKMLTGMKIEGDEVGRHVETAL